MAQARLSTLLLFRTGEILYYPLEAAYHSTPTPLPADPPPAPLCRWPAEPKARSRRSRYSPSTGRRRGPSRACRSAAPSAVWSTCQSPRPARRRSPEFIEHRREAAAPASVWAQMTDGKTLDRWRAGSISALGSERTLTVLFFFLVFSFFFSNLYVYVWKQFCCVRLEKCQYFSFCAHFFSHRVNSVICIILFPRRTTFVSN